MLVLDEPTNDLDAETLELLEDLLTAYQGTLLLVSHDREFLDNVVTSTIGFEGQGVLRDYVGGYQDWLRQGGVWADTSRKALAAAAAVTASPAPPPVPEAPKKTSKLSYKLQRELDELPAEIERREAELSALSAQMSRADFYAQSPEKIAEAGSQMAALEAQLQACYQRWEELASL